MVNPEVIRAYERAGKKYIRVEDDYAEERILKAAYYNRGALPTGQFDRMKHTIDDAIEKGYLDRQIHQLKRVMANDNKEYIIWVGWVTSKDRIGNKPEKEINASGGKYEVPEFSYKVDVVEGGTDFRERVDQERRKNTVYQIPWSTKEFDKMLKDCNKPGAAKPTTFYFYDERYRRETHIPKPEMLRNMTYEELSEFAQSAILPTTATATTATTAVVSKPQSQKQLNPKVETT